MRQVEELEMEVKKELPRHLSQSVSIIRRCRKLFWRTLAPYLSLTQTAFRHGPGIVNCFSTFYKKYLFLKADPPDARGGLATHLLKISGQLIYFMGVIGQKMLMFKPSWPWGELTRPGWRQIQIYLFKHSMIDICQGTEKVIVQFSLIDHCIKWLNLRSCQEPVKINGISDVLVKNYRPELQAI